MATVHMVLQGKGGVGKSFVAATLAQVLSAQGHTPQCVDTDPINKTFAGYARFGARRLELMDGSDIDPRRFDALIEQIVAAEPDQHIIVDNGASSFIPLADYLLSCDVPGMLEEMGHRLHLHTVVTGGQGQLDTLQGLSALLSNFPRVPCIVWLNPVHGRVEHEGKVFEQFEIYLRGRATAEQGQGAGIVALIRIPELNPKTAGRDLSELLKSRRCFDEFLQDPKAPVMSRQRLKTVQKDLFDSVQASGIL